MRFERELLEAYKDVYFFINKRISYKNFAVITAWNPFSQPVSNKDNRDANRRLEHEFLKQNYAKLEVGDIKREWIEESFAVETDLERSVELGRKYNQNAIYFIENDEIYLISCVKGDEQASEKIGCFSSRLKYTGRLPKELK
ncbi:DUF3293 domain-containing protein [Vibrio sp. JC009]|uniref:DUF3293 domain-containing protein n=1 Tax=Vibrio sp. JC009 TaxID=2912314 RepID=UPI0023AE9E99|nr:DUF3293 domain-containing protein [Vibrio sp. JC009]WED22336.1 DUF3293 domain-containing protein [Vibrio sp. JC009]